MICIFDHISYFKDEEYETKELYHIVEQSGMAPALFYDGGIRNAETFYATVKREHWDLIRVKDEHGEIVTIVWLNGYIGRSAMIHFCSFCSLEESIDIGQQVMMYLKNWGHLDSVYGITPKHYRHVFPMLEGIGFDVKLAELPGACYLDKKQRHVTGVASVFNLAKLKLEKIEV